MFNNRGYRLLIIDSFMQNIEISEVRNLLIELQSENVKQAEDRLNSISQNNQFYEVLLYIIRNQNQQQWIRTIGSTLLNTTLDKIVQQKTNVVSDLLREVLCDVNIKQLDKRCFEKVIIRMIVAAGEEIRHVWLDLITEFMKYKLHFDTAYLLIACFAIAEDIPDNVIRIMARNNFEQTISSLQVCVGNANLLNQMMKMWTVVFNRLRMSEQNNEVAYFMANSQYMLNLFDMIYDLQSSNGLIICQIQELYELNLLKFQAAQLNNCLLMFAYENDSNCVNLINHSKKNIPKITNTLLLLAQNQTFIQKCACQDLMIILFTILHSCLTIYAEEFSLSTAVSFFESIISPVIKANDTEIYKFQQSPEQFNSLAEDCCDKQSFGILKTQAIRLLQQFGDKIEGFIKYVVQRGIQSIKIKMGFVTNYSSQASILQIETAFLILSIFSYSIGKLTQEIEIIKVILCDEKLKVLPPFELSRVFTFLAYNYSEVFKDPKQGQGWVSFSITYKAHPTATYCAFDFLGNIVDEYFDQIFLQSLYPQISDGNLGLIWQVISKIIQNHYEQISHEGVISIINRLYMRIQRQVNQIVNKEKENTLDIINCFRQFYLILISINNSLLKDESSQIKNRNVINHYWGLLQFYKTAIKYDIEDEIVKIAIEIVNNLLTVPVELHAVVPEFIATFKNGGYRQKTYFKFINQFIQKSDFQRDQGPLFAILMTLKNAFLGCVSNCSQINGKLKGDHFQRLNLGNVLIIMQNFIAIHGINLIEAKSTEFFQEIASLCLRLLPMEGQEVDKTSSGRIIMSRALNTMFLCHMHLRMQHVIDYFERLESENIYHGYDTQVLVLCFSKQIFKQTDFSLGVKMMKLMITIVDLSLEKDQLIQKKKKTKANKLKNMNQLKKIQQFDKILKTITTPFATDKSINELLLDLFEKLHSIDQQTASKLIQSLPSEVQERLKKYVDINNLNKRKRVIRKIIGIKQAGDMASNIEFQANNTHVPKNLEEQSQSDEDNNNLKRNRIKTKTQKKKQSKNYMPRKIRQFN